jgi:integrase
MRETRPMPRPRKAIRATRRKETGLYSVQYAEDPGRWHATGQDNAADALAWAKRMRGQVLAPKAVLFEDAARNFFADSSPWAQRELKRKRRFSSAYLPQMRGRLKRYLVGKWGETPITEITVRLFEDWILELRGVNDKELKNSSKNKIIDAGKIIFREFAESGLIQESPLASLVHLPPEDETPREIFTADELTKIFPVDRDLAERVWADQGKGHREFGQMWLSFFVALRDTGARPAELLALSWCDWRPKDLGFAINKSVENSTGLIKSSTKTGSKKPSYLSDRGVQELLLWCAVSPHHRPSDLIWSFDGRVPPRTDSAAKHFRGVCDRAEVARGNRTPYCLRHTFATHALETLPLQVVQTLMGHSVTASTILSSYFHPSAATIMRMGDGVREMLGYAEASG